MSHFTSLKTQIVEKEYLKQSLTELGHHFEEGNQQIRGYGGNKTSVEIKLPTRNSGYDLGFRKAGATYELIADWYGIKDIKQQEFLRQITQRYAYHAARVKLEEQGFSLVNEDVQQDGKIHLVLRRMV